MNINPGVSFADNIVTAERLHNLVDNATTSNLGPSDLASGHDFIRSVQPSPSDGLNYLVSATGDINFYDGSSWSPLASASEVALAVNVGATTIEPSWVVVLEGTTNVGIQLSETATRNHRVFGVAAEQIGPSATKLVYTRGMVPVSVKQNLDDPAVAGSFLKGPSLSFHTAAILDDDASGTLETTASAAFGMLLEDVAAGSAIVTAMAWIWR